MDTLGGNLIDTSWGGVVKEEEIEPIEGEIKDQREERLKEEQEGVIKEEERVKEKERLMEGDLGESEEPEDQGLKLSFPFSLRFKSTNTLFNLAHV